VTAAEAAGTSGGVEETTSDGQDEVSAVTELNDETGAFEYTLYSLTAPPYIKLYVPGTMLFCVNSIVVVVVVDKETSFLFQRISVLIQRFNSVLLHDSFIKDGPDQ